ncbi:MAG TPA: DUF3052 domain-containing protein [Verrucomicrobiae bacterium]|nr:DUF3052 domain-containing protein [Verrucomicrobiae bacterium]
MPASTSAGYSGAPLAKKLGIKERSQVLILNAPAGFKKLLEPVPSDVMFQSKADKTTNIGHLFVTQSGELKKQLATLRKKLKPDAAVWVSWPKKSSKVATDITEDTIRALALPMGFVDIKVCAVDEVWSGLKLVVRKELR